jgi:hypothetical protein
MTFDVPLATNKSQFIQVSKLPTFSFDIVKDKIIKSLQNCSILIKRLNQVYFDDLTSESILLTMAILGT